MIFPCHRGCPDKTPERRLDTLVAAGRLAIPFATTLRRQAELISYEVSTVVDGDLPADDHGAVMALA